MTELSTVNELPQWLTKAINTDNEELVKELLSAFNISQEKTRIYHNNPTNFKNAYQYIQHHPAFWWRNDSSSDSRWNTDCYTDQIWAETISNDSNEQKYSWALEAGRAVEEGFTHHYHDLRLDVYGDSIEEAYVKLAFMVSQAFEDDGTDKPNIEHLDPPLLKELRRRIKEYEKGKTSSSEKEND